MFHGSRNKKRFDKDHQQNNNKEDVQRSDPAKVSPDRSDLPIDISDLSRSFLESMSVGGVVEQYTIITTDDRDRLLASEVDPVDRGLSDIEESSVLRDSIEINNVLSDTILASLGPDDSEPIRNLKNKTTFTKKRQSESSDMSTDSGKAAGANQTGSEPKPDAAAGFEVDQPIRESARESAARKRAQLKLLSEESVAAKRAKAMAKFQERVPCISDNCRARGSFESEEQELDRLIAAEEDRDAELRKRPNKCVGFVHREFDKSAFKPSLYMNLYKEPVTVRRVRRKPAEPALPKKQAKPNKTSDLRFKYLHNQKIVSSNAEEHLKKFKRPPFKNPSQFGHSCNDPPAHFAVEREFRKMEKQRQKTRESSNQMLGNRSGGCGGK